MNEKTEILPAGELPQSQLDTEVFRAAAVIDAAAPTEVLSPAAIEGRRRPRFLLPALFGLALLAGGAAGFGYWTDGISPAGPADPVPERPPHADAAGTSTARRENSENGRPLGEAAKTDSPEDRKKIVSEAPEPARPAKVDEPADEKTPPAVVSKTPPPPDRKAPPVSGPNRSNDAERINKTPTADEKKRPDGKKTRQTYGDSPQPSKREVRRRPNERPPLLPKIGPVLREPRGAERPRRPARQN